MYDTCGDGGGESQNLILDEVFNTSFSNKVSLIGSAPGFKNLLEISLKSDCKLNNG